MKIVHALPQRESYQAVIESFVEKDFSFIGRVILKSCMKNNEPYYIATHVFAKKSCVVVLREVIPTLEIEGDFPGSPPGWWEGTMYWWEKSLDDFDLTFPLRKTYWSWVNPQSISFEADRPVSVEDLVGPVFKWFSENWARIAERLPSFNAGMLAPTEISDRDSQFFNKRFSYKRLHDHVEDYGLINLPD